MKYKKKQMQQVPREKQKQVSTIKHIYLAFQEPMQRQKNLRINTELKLIGVLK